MTGKMTGGEGQQFSQRSRGDGDGPWYHVGLGLTCVRIANSLSAKHERVFEQWVEDMEGIEKEWGTTRD